MKNSLTDTSFFSSVVGSLPLFPRRSVAQGDHSFQLISGDGKFNASGLEHFSKEMKLSEHGLSCAVVSIIGPQSTGKSTLLNHLFGTNFEVMDAAVGRSQTTRGIWLAKATHIDPCTLIIDVEGSDSSEREEDVTFEKQSALFALAMSDVLLINLWCHDIGREQAGFRALLKTVFQVMMRLFSPRRRTLLFVIRDKTQTPLECLKKQLLESIQKIYDSFGKPEAHKEAKLNDFFDVEVTSLPHYQYEERAFKKEVHSLRQLFVHSTTSGGLAGDQQDKLPASEISLNAHKIWETIKEYKDLDLPVHKHVKPSYKIILDHLHAAILHGFEENLKNARDNGEPFATAALHLLDHFMSVFDEACKDAAIEQSTLDSSSVRDNLKTAINAHITLVEAQDTIAAAQAAADAQAAAAAQAEPQVLYFVQSTLDSSVVRDNLKTAINAHVTLVEARDAIAAAQAEPQVHSFVQSTLDSSVVRDNLKTAINTHSTLVEAQDAIAAAAQAEPQVQSTLDSSVVRDNLKTAINAHSTLVEAQDAIAAAAQAEPQVQSTLDSSVVRDNLKTAINAHSTLVEAQDAIAAAAQAEPQERRSNVMKLLTTLLELLKRLYSVWSRNPGFRKKLTELLEKLFRFLGGDATDIKKWLALLQSLSDVVGYLLDTKVVV